MWTDAPWTNWGRVERSNSNPFCWATAESLSTVSATTDSYSAGESKVGAGEREGTGDGVEQKCTRAETGSTSHWSWAGEGGEPSGVVSLRAGPSGVGRMRAGTLEVTGRITCSNVTCCNALLQFLLCLKMQQWSLFVCCFFQINIINVIIMI